MSKPEDTIIMNKASFTKAIVYGIGNAVLVPSDKIEQWYEQNAHKHMAYANYLFSIELKRQRSL